LTGPDQQRNVRVDRIFLRSKALRSRIIARPFLCALLALCFLPFAGGCARDRTGELPSRIESHIAESGADVVGVYFRDLTTGDTLLIDADVRMHAASTMKVPVMMQLFRDEEAARLSLDDSLAITKTFRSIVDGSPYELGAPDDSDTTLYRRLGENESIRALTEYMITVSSNLAANMLIEHVGAERVQATMQEFGADSIEVVRGVEDTKAYEAGLSNTTTARDLGVIFGAIAECRSAALASCEEMASILSRQQFNQGIPAGLPAGTRVAHKTGSITEIRHDGGIVADHTAADRLIADISRLVFEHVTQGTESGARVSRAPRIAITIDDLPWNGPAPDDGVAAGTERLLQSLAGRGVVATGFVNCGRASTDDPVLRLWLDRGMALGNHTTGHRDLNSAPLDAWLDDVRTCDTLLRGVNGESLRFFRYPMLHQGPTAERRDAALTLLRELGYEIGHVTVDNSEYLIRRPYDDARSAGDDAERERLAGLLIEHILAMARHAREVAERKVGRDVDHVLLLHASSLVADNMDALLDALEAEGFEFITLEEALEDPVYGLADGYLGPKGLSWLYRIEPVSLNDEVWDDEQAARVRARLER
jgi:beta-lactamase class A